MNLSTLIKHLSAVLKSKGDVEVDIITEHDEYKTKPAWQVEQPAGDVAYSPRDNRVKIVPEDF